MPTLNQRRRETTRLEIADAALVLFAEHGYPNVTAEAIAEAAQVSLRTFYRYFPAKDHVLRPLVEVRARRVADGIAERPAQEPLDVAVRRAIEKLNEPLRSATEVTPFIRVLTDTPEVLRRWMGDLSVYENPLSPVVAERLGPSATEAEVRYSTAALVTALRLAFEESLRGGRLDLFPDRLGEILAFLASGGGLSS